MNHVLKTSGLVLLLSGGVALAEQAAQPAAPDPRPAMEATLQAGLSGRWWTNPQIINRLGLTPDQQKRMDAIFLQNRLKLIDLTAALDKEEAQLEPLMEADQPDATSIRSQIDRIVQARSELEKANANMLLGIRLVLTPSQWKDMHLRGNGPRPANPSPVPRKLQ